MLSDRSSRQKHIKRVFLLKTPTQTDAIQELLDRFEHGGFGDVVRSWIGTGQNESIDPAHVDASLGPHVAELSRASGIPRETLVQELARLLPSVIDRLTPEGKLTDTMPLPTPARP